MSAAIVDRPRSWDPYGLRGKMLLVGLALSLLIHLGMIGLASIFQKFSKSELAAPTSIPIELITLPKISRGEETLQATSKIKPKDAKFESSRNLMAEEDTSPSLRKSSMAKAGGQRQTEQERARSKAKSVARGKTVFSLSQNDLLVAERTERETLSENGMGLESQGFIDRIKRGEQLKISAIESDYGNYVLRIKRKLVQHWDPNSASDAQMYRYNEVRVVVGVVLDRDGEIVELRLLNKSIFSRYDDEALRTWRTAAPFPNPPKSLIQDDGLIYFPWTFVLYTRGFGGNVQIE